MPASSRLRPGASALTRALAVFGSLAGLALGACSPHVFGNGVYAEKTFPVPAFDRVAAGLHVEATITAGAATRSVLLSGDENIVLQYAKLEVVDSTLTLSTSESFTQVHPLRLRIATPELVGVEAVEGARFHVTGAGATAFEVRGEEGSRISLAGTPPAGATLSVDLATGAALDAHAYPVSGAAVTLASHSEATLQCTGSVSGSAEGGSSVAISGGGTCAVTLGDGSSCTAEP